MEKQIINHITGNTYYVSDGYSLIPFYMIDDKNVVLIDSGLFANPKWVEEFERRGYHVEAVLVTHLHVDHVENNVRFLEQGATIYAEQREIDLVNTADLWSEEYNLPPEDFKADYTYPIQGFFTGEDRFIDIKGARFETILTYGHSIAHTSFVTPDGVCCVGDTIVSLDLLKGMKLPFMTNMRRAMDAMETIGRTEYPYYALSHLAVLNHDEMLETVRVNIEKEEIILNEVESLVTEPIDARELVAKFFEKNDIVIPKPNRYRTTSKSMIARIEELVIRGRLKADNEFVYPDPQVVVSK